LRPRDAFLESAFAVGVADGENLELKVVEWCEIVEEDIWEGEIGRQRDGDWEEGERVRERERERDC